VTKRKKEQQQNSSRSDYVERLKIREVEVTVKYNLPRFSGPPCSVITLTYTTPDSGLTYTYRSTKHARPIRRWSRHDLRRRVPLY